MDACHTCACKLSHLQAIADLALPDQDHQAQHHPQLPKDAPFCSLGTRYTQTSPFFAAQPSATLLEAPGIVTLAITLTNPTSATTVTVKRANRMPR